MTARFFDKSALAIVDVVAGVGFDELVKVLNAATVEVVFGSEVTETHEGRVSLELLTNLLSRLYSRLLFTPNGTAAKSHIEYLEFLANSINPRIELLKSGVPTVIICLGREAIKHAHVYIGASGWVASVSKSPVSFGNSLLPFGAAAAACLGAAEVFRHVFGTHLQSTREQTEFCLNLLTMACETSIDAQSSSKVNIGDVHLVGAGAIGNAVLWTLSKAPLQGCLNVIDPQDIELSNLQRYVLTSDKSEGFPKTAVAAELLTSTELSIKSHQVHWRQFISGHVESALQRVLVAVDNAVDRAEIQAALPCWCLNGWTQPGDLGISRHYFDGSKACLVCLYVPEGLIPSEDELVANALQIPERRVEVRTLLAKHALLTEEFLRSIASGKGIDFSAFEPFVGKSIGFLYRAICGGALINLNLKSPERRDHVPLAFQSAMAGVLMAAELAKHAAGLAAASPVITRMDILNLEQNIINFSPAKRSDGMCICQDPEYLKVYRERHHRGLHDQS